MRPLGKCYVCDEEPIGLLRGMPACAACRKFITRHRHINWQGLRCEVGGSNSNKCDITKRRTCKRCRLKRSVELNPTLKHFIETKIMKSTIGIGVPGLVLAGSNNGQVMGKHDDAIGRLRDFIVQKRPGSIGNNSDRSDDLTFVAISDSSSDGSPMMNVCRPSPSLSSVSEAMITDSSNKTAAPVIDHQMTTIANVIEPIMRYARQAMDPSSTNFQIVSLAVRCIPSTFPIFLRNFVGIFEYCTMAECQQILMLAECSNIATSMMSTCSPNDLIDAFNVYSSVVMAASEATPREVIIETARKNACFAHFAKTPLRMLANVACMPATAANQSSPLPAAPTARALLAQL